MSDDPVDDALVLQWLNTSMLHSTGDAIPDKFFGA
jgi:hypothetical protein